METAAVRTGKGTESIWYGAAAQRRQEISGCAHGKGHRNKRWRAAVPDNGRTLCSETSWRQRMCARKRPREAYGTELLRRDVMETAAVRTEKGTEIKDGGQLAPTMAGRCALRRRGDCGCAHGKGLGGIYTMRETEEYELE